MFAACSLLNFGCLLRVSSEIPAYEGFTQLAWHVLPCSAIAELIAVSLFALNLAFTLTRRAAPVDDPKLYTISLFKEPRQI